MAKLSWILSLENVRQRVGLESLRHQNTELSHQELKTTMKDIKLLMNSDQFDLIDSENPLNFAPLQKPESESLNRYKTQTLQVHKVNSIFQRQVTIIQVKQGKNDARGRSGKQTVEVARQKTHRVKPFKNGQQKSKQRNQERRHSISSIVHPNA